MHRHHEHTRIAGTSLFVNVREQGQLIDEARERWLRTARFVFASGRHELHQILDPALRLFATLFAEILQVPTLIDNRPESNRHRLSGRHRGQPGNQISKRGERGLGTRSQDTLFRRVYDAGPQRVRGNDRLKSGCEERQLPAFV